MLDMVLNKPLQIVAFWQIQKLTKTRQNQNT